MALDGGKAASWRCASISPPTWAPTSRNTRRFIPYIGVTMSTGVYDIPTFFVAVNGVYTDACPVDAYRGAVDRRGRWATLLAPSVTRRLVERFVRTAPSPPARELGKLTPRELEVLELIARGRSNAELAADLVISETTAKTHVARILAKLRLRDRVQAVVFAYEHGIVHPGAS